MKIPSRFQITFAILALGSLLLSAPAAPATSKPRLASAIPTNPPPKSVFSMPASRKDGCDPFFPNSTRLWGLSVTAAPVTKSARPVGLDCLVLKGLSGLPGNRLAIINGRTMGSGEDAEIVTDCGRLSVHCVDVTSNSAIVEVAGQRRELRLRADF